MAYRRVSRNRRSTGSGRRRSRTNKRVSRADLQRPQLYRASARSKPQTVRLVLEHVGAQPQLASLPAGPMQTFNRIQKARM